MCFKILSKFLFILAESLSAASPLRRCSLGRGEGAVKVCGCTKHLPETGPRGGRVLQQGSAANPGFPVAKPGGCEYRTLAEVCGKAPSVRSFYPFPALSAVAFPCLFPSPLEDGDSADAYQGSASHPFGQGPALAMSAASSSSPLHHRQHFALKTTLFWDCFMNPHLLQRLLPRLAFPRCFSGLPKPPWCGAA